MPNPTTIAVATMCALLLCACQARTETVAEPPILGAPTLSEGSAQTETLAEAEAPMATEIIPEAPVTEDDVTAIANASTDFAADLWGEVLADHDGNALVSPASVFLAFLMTEAGADGTTREEMVDVLQLPPGPQHAAAGALATLLQSDEGPTIQIANRIWVEGSWMGRLQAQFQSTLREAYNAEAGVVPFATDPEAARAEINQWVSEQTQEKITELLPESSIDSLVRLVLTNTVYFHASWDTAFNAATTADAPFTTPSGVVTVPMMSQRSNFPFVETDSWQAVELLYEGEDWSLIAVLPKDDGDIDLASVPAAFARAQAEPIALSFPRFTYRHAFSVVAPMQRLGMTSAFDPNGADFARMAVSGRDGGLFISRAVHEAVVEVTETGTEAAAATAVVMSSRGMAPPEPEHREVRFDRSFEFVIQHRPTGTTLFMGRVEDPTAE